MILRYKDYENPIIEKQRCTIFLIEHNKFMYEFLNDLYLDLENITTNFYLSLNEKSLKPEKNIDWVRSVWDVNLNDRKSINALNKYLASVVIEKGLDVEINSLWLGIEDIITDILIQEEALYIPTQLPDLAKIIALSGVRFEEGTEKPLAERIIDYMMIKTTYTDVELFIYHNMLFLLGEKEFNEILRFAYLEDLYLLFIENNLQDYSIIDLVDLRILDQDLCWL